MEYRLLKDLTVVIPSGLLETAPKGTKLITEALCYFLPLPSGEKTPLSDKVIEKHPEWFERVIDWTKEKYFRNGCESNKLTTKGKIYPITKAAYGRCYYINNNGDRASFELNSDRAKLSAPATEAEFLEQGKKNQPEGIPWYHDFRDAKVGDKVYDLEHGEGTISELSNGQYWFIKVTFDSGFSTYSENGKPGCMALPTLYKSKPTIIPPERPKEKVKKSKTLYCNFYKESSKVKSYSSIEEAEKMSSPFCDVIAQPVTFEWEEDA